MLSPALISPPALLLVVGIGGFLLVTQWLAKWKRIAQLDGRVNQAIGTLAAQYRQRSDLIPDVHQAAKAAVQAQSEYLNRMLAARVQGRQAPDRFPASRAGEAVRQTGLPGLGVTVESNPALDPRGYAELQAIMRNTEKDVAAARRFYWAAVAEYNVCLATFPGNLVAGVHGYRPLPKATLESGLETKPDYGIGTPD